MTTTRFVDVGTRVQRKLDSATGTIVRRHAATNRNGTRTTLLDIRLDDETLRQAAGGDMTGDLSWFASYFRAL